ncbi:agamous-like MADS-box protein AGL80 [Gastrolobium bilobum]|uniref:agamous-like MADS-box protein AGL80 n=1 Tax=Gastrolobium bilobum TaxID=150636 RepID=UPI002AB2CAA1|nr:agamous-like MADS-box protein AGL80 [Gastrolobium bilobum]
MTRKKVKLAFIVNDAARKATYKKRKKGLMKKVDELTTLCGIEACAIVYSPYDSQPEVWPSPWGVQKALAKFRTMPELEQSKKMVNQETFLKQRILKAKEQVKKQNKDNREKEMTLLMLQCLSAGKLLHDNLTMVDLNDLAWLIDQNLKDVDRRLETMNKNSHMTPSQAQMIAPVAKNEYMTPVDHGHGFDMNVDTMQKQWFMDLINNNGDETMPFGDVNLQNGFCPNPLLP